MRTLIFATAIASGAVATTPASAQWRVPATVVPAFPPALPWAPQPFVPPPAYMLPPLPGPGWSRTVTQFGPWIHATYTGPNGECGTCWALPGPRTAFLSCQ